MTPDDYVRLCRARGITTEVRLRRTVRRRFPLLEEWQIDRLIRPIPQVGLWADGFPRPFMGMQPRSDPVFRPWSAEDS